MNGEEVRRVIFIGTTECLAGRAVREEDRVRIIRITANGGPR